MNARLNALNLLQIPAEAFFQVLYKFDNFHLCRMRKTCKYVNQFVEKRRKKLAKRRVFREYCGRCDITIRHHNRIEVKNPTINYGVAFNGPLKHLQKLSAISFRNATLIYDNNESNLVALIELLQKLELSCISFLIENVPSGQTQFLANLVYCKQLSAVTKTADGIRYLENLLKIKQNIHTVHIAEQTNKNCKGLWELIRNCSSVNFGIISEEDFGELLRDIFRSTNIDMINELHVQLRFDIGITTLWEKHVQPPYVNYVLFKQANLGFGSFYTEIDIIYVIEMGSKCLIIGENYMKKIITLDFTEKGSQKYFNFITESCKIVDQICPKAFFATTPEFQQKMIENAVLAAAYKNNHIDVTINSWMDISSDEEEEDSFDSYLSDDN